MAIKGVNQVKINIKKTFAGIDKQASRAAFAALTVLDQEQALIAPILTSNLVNNRTLSIDKANGIVFGEIKFLSEYAAPVHSMVGVNWTRASTKEQWLATAAKTARPEIDSIIKKVMKI